MTKLLGTCPCCGRLIATRGALLVHHGYQRPGYGYIEGDCWAVGRTPHETSPDTAKAYLEVLQAKRTETLQTIAQAPQWTSLTEIRKVRFGQFESIEHKPGTYDFDLLRANKLFSLKNRLDRLEQDILRVQQMIDTWQPLPLISKQQADRLAADELAAQKAEQAKLAAERAERAIPKLVAQVTQAVEAQDFQAIASLWGYSGVGEAACATSQTRIQVLKQSGLDKVFACFGLRAGAKYQDLTNSNQRAIELLGTDIAKITVETLQGQAQEALKLLK